MANHTLVHADITESNIWHKDRGTFNVSLKLTLAEGNRYKYSAKIISSKEDTETVIVPETEYTNISNISFPVDRTIITEGSNTLQVTVVDEIESETMTTIYEYNIIGETRDSFTIERGFNYPSEYFIYNNGNIDKDDKFNVTTKGIKGLSGIAVNKKAIQMDGRSRIQKITVTSDPDVFGESSRVYKYDEYQDRGDNVVTTYNLGDINIFKNIKSMRSK